MLDPLHPFTCMDGYPKQLVTEEWFSVLVIPRKAARDDYEYRRGFVCNIFLPVRLGQKSVFETSQIIEPKVTGLILMEDIGPKLHTS